MRRPSSKARAEAIPAPAAESELDLAALGRALWARKFRILAVTLAAGVLSFLAVNMITPRYKSEARVLIENRETPYNQAQGERNMERDRTLLDAEAVQSQVQLALSRDLARGIIRDLKFAERPEFNPNAGGSLLDGLLGLAGMSRARAPMSDEDKILERYFERLNVYQVDKSRVISIEFQSQDAEFAARVANAVAEGYIKLQQQAKQDAIRQAGQWLAGEIERLRTRVAEAESKVEEFRVKSNLYVGPNNNSLSAQSLGELNTQLASARTKKADAETKARIIRDILKSGRPVETSEVLNSDLIRRLNEQRVTLRAQLAEQSSTLLDQHPRIKELRAQIADLEAQTRIAADKMARGYENDARIAAAQADAILVALDQQKKMSGSLNSQDVQLRALERDAKSQRDLLETYLSRYRDTVARETPDAVQADARIISRAIPSTKVHFPKKLPIVFIVTFGVLVAMTGFLAASQLLRGEVYRPVEAVPALAEDEAPIAPAMPRTAQQNYAESPRAGPLTAQVRAMGRGVVVVTRTASEPSSELALDLARELSEGGAHSVFVDLDAETAVSRKAGAQSGIGDLLLGKVSFGEAIERDPKSRAHILGAGRITPDIAAILSADRFSIVLGALAQSYDHIVIAAPNLIGYSSASRLARFTRGTVVVTLEGNSDAGIAAAETLRGMGFPNIAVVAVAPEPDPKVAPEVAAA
ncbi:MAG: lipopolysaccharide biosynthesis protein [Xanthobacteraceae bacterium]|nr:lipopolysaccharide biosynthesis protein [Xanthobacteraceae bacterium]MBX3533113.1 lipopolysaccharide biosynthesis protein [Xanthobacteraceae bacterium]MCW5677339.1 lipopolysaccharide biosynthesis protein [Xanthobacteraceae bacterium]